MGGTSAPLTKNGIPGTQRSVGAAHRPERSRATPLHNTSAAAATTVSSRSAWQPGAASHPPHKAKATVGSARNGPPRGLGPPPGRMDGVRPSQPVSRAGVGAVKAHTGAHRATRGDGAAAATTTKTVELLDDGEDMFATSSLRSSSQSSGGTPAGEAGAGSGGGAVKRRSGTQRGCVQCGADPIRNPQRITQCAHLACFECIRKCSAEAQPDSGAPAPKHIFQVRATPAAPAPLSCR